MRPIGFSTGAVAAGRFKDGLELLRGRRHLQFSALPLDELEPLVERLPAPDRHGFVSFHEPSRFSREAGESLLECCSRSPRAGCRSSSIHAASELER